MKKIVIHSGFHPEIPRSYHGENIFAVKDRIETYDITWHLLENDVWIREIGKEQYITDWTHEERWGRVEEVELDEEGAPLSARELGFVLLLTDRRKGVY